MTNTEESSFAFKIDDYQQKTVLSKGLMVDAGATSHIINGIKNLKDETMHSNQKTIIWNWLMGQKLVV